MTRQLAGAFAAGAAIVAMAAPAHAQGQGQAREYHIAAGSLQSALDAWALQSGRQIIYRIDEIRGAVSPGASGTLSADAALSALLSGSGFGARADASGAVAIVRLKIAQDADPTNAQAASGTEAPASNTDIVITGSNIRGGRSASPTTVITRQDIDRSGLATTEQLISRLPQQFSGSASENTVGGLTGGAQSGFNVSDGTGLDLRGLGTDSTLVLINGRRVAATGIGNFVDLSLIPLSAVERVEIVADGASAIYGSDAVGGVANFILRKDFDGAETRARFGTVTSGDTREYQLGQIAGATWSGGNILASYEYYQRGNLDANDRSFAEDTEDPFDLLPKQRRHSFFVTVNQEVGDNVELFADGMYAHRKSKGNFTFSGFPQISGAITEQYGFTVGSRIKLGRHWQVEARGTYDHNDTNQLTLLGSDFFGNSYSADVKADGPLVHIAGGDVRLALGGQYRRETLHRERTDPTFGFDFVANSKRDVWAGFGELFAPLVGAENEMPGVKRLELTLAGRFDHYSDFGSTFNPKVGLLWSPADGLKLRGTWGTAFRAPLLFELDESANQFIPFPALDPSSPSGVTNALVIQGGNAGLGPEKARTLSAGFDYSPPRLPALDLSATYFSIDFKDRIGDPPLLPLIIEGLGSPTVAPFVTRNVPQSVILAFAAMPGFLNIFGIPLDQITAIADFRTTNLARTKVRGIDGSARYHFDVGGGRVDLGLAATYLIDHKTKFAPGGSLEELVNTRFNPVGLIARGSLGWSRGGLSANAYVNYTNSYKDPTSVSGEVFHIDSWTTVDLALQYDTGKRPKVRGLRNLIFGLTVLNLFDQDPPFVRNDNGLNFDGANANALGRFISFQVTKKW